jgi:AraC family transcriptional regulator
MNPQIKKVTYYIEKHLDEQFDVDMLAKVAGYSSFHFCRIFKLYLGESVMSYVNRLKLERAAKDLMLKKKSMIEVALDAGYLTPTGFLKAFKLRFGTTPSAYKEHVNEHFVSYKEIKMNQPHIEEREEVSVVFVRELGDYNKSSDKAWKKLSQKLGGLEKAFKKHPPSYEMMLTQENSETLGICHDDPKVTEDNNIRYDAAIAWGEKEVNELGKYDFETKKIAGGKYAVVDYRGDANAEDAWYGLYAWVEEQGYTFRDEPAFEKYIDAWNNPDTKNLKTLVYVPIA